MELWIPGTHITRDGFGFIDLVAIIEDKTFGIQVCRGGDVAAHVDKVLAAPDFPRVAKAWTIVVVGWREVTREFGAPSWVPRVVHCRH